MPTLQMCFSVNQVADLRLKVGLDKRLSSLLRHSVPVQRLHILREHRKTTSDGYRHPIAFPHLHADPPRNVARQHRNPRLVAQIRRGGVPNTAVRHQHAAGAARHLHLVRNRFVLVDAVVSARVSRVPMAARHNPGAAVLLRKRREHPQRDNRHRDVGEGLVDVPGFRQISEIVRPVGMVGAEKRVAVVRRDGLQLGLSDSHVRVIEHRLGNPQHPLVAEGRARNPARRQ